MWLKALCTIVCLAGLLAIPAVAIAGQVSPQSEVDPDPTFEGQALPDPVDVPGKEYSNDVDKDALGSPDPGQVVHWEGDGVTVWDSFDYSSASIPGLPGPGGGNPTGHIAFEEDDQVDALGNIRDKYFLDMIADRVPLLVSFDQVADVHVSRSSLFAGAAGVWAAASLINSNTGALDDLDGLEVWGPDDSDDADMYSRVGDLATDVSGNRVSVYRFDPTTSQSVPYLLTQTLLGVVVDDTDEFVDWYAFDPLLFDLDAMIIWDVSADNEFGIGDGVYGDDMIIFSVKAIGGLFDGGEIWTYTFGDAKAQFLNHGGMVWNSANDVAGHFTVATDEINALEALPEPVTLSLIGIGGLVLLTRTSKRRRG